MSAHSALPVQRLRFWAFAIPLAIALSSWATLALADSWPTRPYYYFVHWVAMGQPDAALAQFADDAVVVAGPLCTAQRPCVGKAEIRARYIAPLLARPGHLPIAEAFRRPCAARVRRVAARTVGASAHATARRRTPVRVSRRPNQRAAGRA